MTATQLALRPVSDASDVLVEAKRATADGGARVGLRDKFPPRPTQLPWPQTELDREGVLAEVTALPVASGDGFTAQRCRRGVSALLTWLDRQPGESWQEKWLAGGAERLEPARWLTLPEEWFRRDGPGNLDPGELSEINTGLMVLMCCDVVRPNLAWLLRRRSMWLRTTMAQVRDPDGFARLRAQATAENMTPSTTNATMNNLTAILAAKGGMIKDITVGDCVELLDTEDAVHGRYGEKSSAYRLLYNVGIFPPDAPPTVRAFRANLGQRTVDQMVDQHRIACRPVRDLLVDYLKERRASLDYGTLVHLAWSLGKVFWRDLEIHHPGIDSPRLTPVVAAAWKQRVRTKVTKVKTADGEDRLVETPRANALGVLISVRAFYLDIAQWAAEDPARWAAWAVPSPVSAADLPRSEGNRVH